MVVQMTNRLLAIVMAVAFSTGLVAHAAENPKHPLPELPTLPSPASLKQPAALIEMAAQGLRNQASAILNQDSSLIRDAYQRDHVALEQLRQQASSLRGSAHPAFNQLINKDQALLLALEQQALNPANGTTSGDAAATIGQMDQIVRDAAHALSLAQAQTSALKSNSSANASGQGKP
jgi:hypothetical protein